MDKEIKIAKLTLLPPRPDVCQICARDHEPHYPHDQTSIYYHTKFHMEHGRAPTWDDAMAHCTDEMKKTWRESMERVKEIQKQLEI